ncbi:MAG: hypothetical protein JNK67_26140 [Alphaproteobacteria bacterium]|nr:hypothetical protein [Alphaproteobacteria bacterium]
MSYKPSDFFVGVGDFFGIIMPGAIATVLLAPTLESLLAAMGGPRALEGPGLWVALAVGAYVVGHLVFMVGAFFDSAYDRLVRPYFWPASKDALFASADAEKKALLGSARNHINAYKFTKALLSFHHAGAAAEIARLEADSKFFRSMAALLLMATIVLWSNLGWGQAASLIVLFALAFSRYAERRWQSSQTAYGYLLVYAVAPPKGATKA